MGEEEGVQGGAMVKDRRLALQPLSPGYYRLTLAEILKKRWRNNT